MYLVICKEYLIRQNINEVLQISDTQSCYSSSRLEQLCNKWTPQLSEGFKYQFDSLDHWVCLHWPFSITFDETMLNRISLSSPEGGSSCSMCVHCRITGAERVHTEGFAFSEVSSCRIRKSHIQWIVITSLLEMFPTINLWWTAKFGVQRARKERIQPSEPKKDFKKKKVKWKIFFLQ